MSHFSEDIVGTRARFQRLSDSTVLYGWITEFGHDHVSVAVPARLFLQPGDRFVFQVHTTSATVRFIADYSGLGPVPEEAPIADFECVQLFKVLGRIEQGPAQEEGRLRLNNRPVEIAWDDKNIDGQLYDISPTGAGVITSQALESGIKVRVTVKDQARAITVEAEVRYSTSVEGQSELYRIGLKLVESSRLASAQWRSLLDVA